MQSRQKISYSLRSCHCDYELTYHIRALTCWLGHSSSYEEAGNDQKQNRTLVCESV